MNDDIKKLLLASKTLMDFDAICYQYKLIINSVIKDTEIAKHRDFLKNKMTPFDEIGENIEFFRYSNRESAMCFILEDVKEKIEAKFRTLENNEAMTYIDKANIILKTLNECINQIQTKKNEYNIN